MTTDFRLRLLTLNTQLMDIPFVDDHDRVMKSASLIAARLIADSTPDILCLNEVFDEEARKVLIDQLVGTWPHVAGPFGPTRTMDLPSAMKVATALVGGVVGGIPGAVVALGVDALAELIVEQYGPEDSGLMVFSRYPISDSDFHSYTEGEGWDWWADKGVAFASIHPNPMLVVNLFVSHTQASYVSIVENDEIRAKQVAEAISFIEQKARPDQFRPRALTVLAGDLNVYGGPGQRPEWEDYFDTPNQYFDARAVDVWDEFISPAESDWLTDAGTTVGDHPEGSHQAARLDYVVVGDKPVAIEAPRFVAQQMRLAHPGVSDHVGLYAELNLETPNCYPVVAESISNTNDCVPVDLPYGGVKWFRFERPGTWSFRHAENATCRVFYPDNLSQPVANNGIDDIVESGQANWASDLPSPAGTFELPRNSLVCISFESAALVGTTYFGYLLHDGTSPFTPLLVKPQYPVRSPDFDAIADAAVGAEPTQLWFRSELDETRFQKPVIWQFEVANHSGAALQLRLLEWAGTPSEVLRAVADNDGDVIIDFENASHRSIYWCVDRQPGQRDFGCRLRSPLTYMQSSISGNAKFPTLRCVDETGPTDWGSDEIRMRMRPDSEGGEIGLMSEHDMDDDGPSIILVPGVNGTWTPEETGFSSHLELTIIESDDDGPSTHSVDVPGLSPDTYFEDRTIKLEFAGADYRYSVRLAREPHGLPPV